MLKLQSSVGYFGYPDKLFDDMIKPKLYGSEKWVLKYPIQLKMFKIFFEHI